MPNQDSDDEIDIVHVEDDDESSSTRSIMLRMDTLQEEESGGEESSNHSSSGYLSSGKGGRANRNSNARDVVRNMVGRESKQIFWLRLTAMAVLVVATCLTSFAIFRVSRQAELHVFESQFKGEALILKDTLRSNVVHMIRSMDNFAIMMTSHAQETTSGTWPYEVVPQFEIRGASTMALLGPAAELFTFLPLITPETRDTWEFFSAHNMQWIELGHEREELLASGAPDDGHNHDGRRRHYRQRRHLEEANVTRTLANSTTPTTTTVLANFSSGISSSIFGFHNVGHRHQAIEEPRDGSSIYFPVWQTTPVHEELVNYNVYGHGSFGQDMRASVASKSIVFGRVADVSDIHDPFTFLHVKVPKEGEDTHEDHDETAHGDHEDDHDSHEGEEEGEHHDDEDESEHHDDEDESEHHDDEEADHHEDETTTNTTTNNTTNATAVEEEDQEDETTANSTTTNNSTNATAVEEEDLNDEGTRRLTLLCRRRRLQNATVQEGEEEHADHDEHEEEHGDEEEEEHHEEEEHDEDEHEDSQGEEEEEHHDLGDPLSMVFFPVFDDLDKDPQLVGFLSAAIYWGRLFANALPADGSGPIHVVLENGCGQVFTYSLHPQRDQAVDGGTNGIIRIGNHHEDRYADLELEFFLNSLDAHYEEEEESHSDAEAESSKKAILTYSGVGLDLEYCPYTVRIYPTAEMEHSFYTWQPLKYAMMVVFVLVFTSVIFWVYDSIVERRQRKVAQTAVDSTAVIHSLFPSNVRDRLLQQQQQQDTHGGKSAQKHTAAFLNNGDRTLGKESSPPIADLFPCTTVMFADISGFTAWSSSREPTQVFTLLETVYGAFDKIARKRRVFKVETIGDCYVAVTGLPEPQSDHAVIMARFASECHTAMTHLTKEMMVTLGPDTGDLIMRFGLHSGPVTAGVLRGEKSRFQLFGDTVNTASRMESTGIKGQIQCSESTMKLLVKAGKNHWVVPREDTVCAKGKGEMKTYWLFPTATSSGGDKSSNRCSTEGSRDNLGLLEDSKSELDVPSLPHKQKKTDAVGDSGVDNDKALHQQRLIDWSVDVLQNLLLQVVEQRRHVEQDSRMHRPSVGADLLVWEETSYSRPIEEICEAIALPKFGPSSVRHLMKQSHHDAKLPPEVISQLRAFVTKVAALYNDNPFHNFSHATHVSMAAVKLINRIKTVDHLYNEDDTTSMEALASNVHDYTCGIATDPLAHFAIVFSALIHDMDHPGVPNGVLISEDTDLARHFENKSIAEQNSVVLAWTLLLEPSYIDLRTAIFSNQAEHDRFRKLVVNAVLATDIFDKDLQKMRTERWDKAFAQETPSIKTEDKEAPNDDINSLKASVILEHLIQVSDVSHCMQHWMVYQKWNEKLFHEMYQSFASGRTSKDPSEGWYEGELWFFDNYVIPLGKNLNQCQVFGVSTHGYLDYAIQNRLEWELKGNEQVKHWLDLCRA